MSDERVFGMKAEAGRWVFVLVGLLMNVCLGAVYAFSVFRKPLEGLWGISATQAGLPFMVFLATFALLMALAGGLVASWGPRKTSLLGAALVGAGWILAGFASNIVWLTIFYGVIGGSGVGILYGCPIAVAAKWFPDKKGLAVGLTLAGFGLSALLMAPLMTNTIAMETVGVSKTFMYFGTASSPCSSCCRSACGTRRPTGSRRDGRAPRRKEAWASTSTAAGWFARRRSTPCGVRTSSAAWPA